MTLAQAPVAKERAIALGKGIALGAEDLIPA